MAHLKYLILILVLFTGCEKKIHCWECESVIYNSIIIDNVCDEDDNYIKEYEYRLKSLYGDDIEIKCTLIK